MANDQQDLEKHGAEDELRGRGNQAAGWFQRTFGRLTGNRKTQAKGAVREFGGKVQAKGGQLEQKVEQKLEEQDQKARQEQAQADAEAAQRAPESEV